MALASPQYTELKHRVQKHNNPYFIDIGAIPCGCP